MHNKEFIQQTVLNGILYENSWIERIKDIDSDLFPNSYYRSIFTAMKAIYKTNKPINLVALSEELVGVISPSEMYDYLDQKHYFQDLSNFQDCVNRLIGLYMNLYLKRVSVDDLEATEKIQKMNDFVDKYSYEEINVERINEIWEEREELEKQGHFERVLELGLSSIDKKLEIIREDLVVIGARTSVGKSAFGIQIMANLSVKRISQSFIYFNLEMGKYQVEKRFRNHKVSESLMIYNSSSVKIQQIRNIIERERPAVICIDQLNKIRPDRPEKTIRENFVITMTNLKEICKDYGIVIFVMAQLRRNTLKSDRPTLSDFKESGSIEEEADIVLLLDRKEKDVAIFCDKYRNGETFTEALKFEGIIQKFYEPGKYDEVVAKMIKKKKDEAKKEKDNGN